MKSEKLLKYLNNPVSLVGFSFIAISLLTFVFFITIDFFFEDTSPYLGVITFVIIPAVIILGLLLVPIGGYREKIRLHKRGETPHRFLTIDFNDPHHRVIFSVFSVLTVLFLMILSVASYHAFELTESVEFCGQLCHTVMEPEYTAYTQSPHARVSCVQCHVGEGASWYVKSKLSGAYQVYATLFNKYPRPIPTPIKNLRPAQETCEKCHWPQNFFNDKVVIRKYFLKNEENTPGFTTMLMKIGGGSLETMQGSGIHWHMNIKNKIQYITTDETRLIIPWIQKTDPEGNVTIYQDEGSPLNSGEIDSLPKRTMDCVDCHNRPSHIYQSPHYLINQLMAIGQISKDIPEIRQVASDALTANYITLEAAQEEISTSINSFYQDNYSEHYTEYADLIGSAIVKLQDAYSKNFFPEMNVRWDIYPDHIGHQYSPGCMRCHDGKHFDGLGNSISYDCNSCHTIVAQGAKENTGQLNYQGIEFIHPEDIGGEWQTTICSECHIGE